ncbi:hypothetical protein HOD75_00115 [archaeon]|jgi:hypothetical protein|nr:hypothetical protein [Candidatus Woesearchaeota archaeon]MBT4241281.1 hypothetical protein [archaeon]MBT4418103.1 hypothetical protein [archaeon]
MVTTNNINICKICNKEKKVNGNLVCNWCYRREIWKPKLQECPRCKRTKPHHSKGYCKACYNYVFFIDNTKAHNYKKYHNIDFETYKRLTKSCLICNFDKVVDLHHLDEDHNNNNEDNLIGLCPNHHKMLHDFRYKDEIQQQIQQCLNTEDNKNTHSNTDDKHLFKHPRD